MSAFPMMLPTSASLGWGRGFHARPEHPQSTGVAFADIGVHRADRTSEDAMAKIEHVGNHQRVVETPTEARQAERGPSVLALLTVSTLAAVFVLAIVWFVFFRT
jgi:hypothetical protein